MFRLRLMLGLLLIGLCLLLALRGKPQEPARRPPPRSAPPPAARKLRAPVIRWPFPQKAAEQQEMARAGKDLFFDKGCWTCHKLGREPLPGGQDRPNVGPDLAGVGARLPVDRIAESILNPSAVIAEPSGRHSSHGTSNMSSFLDELTLGELVDLVFFLSRQK